MLWKTLKSTRLLTVSNGKPLELGWMLKWLRTFYALPLLIKIRGLLAEYGITVPQGVSNIRQKF